MTAASETGRDRKKEIQKDFLVAAAYLAVAAVMTWPLVIHPWRYVISEHMDAVTAFYNLWWFHHALCDLHVSFWTSPLIDYPYGYSMILFPIWVPYDALALPIVHAGGIAGVPVAFNLIYLLSFAACGYTAFVLIRYVTRDPSAAFVAGLFLAFVPYRFWNVTRWHVTCLELVAPTLYFFLRMMRGEGRWSGAGFAIGATLLAYMSPNYTVDVALALAALLAVMAVMEREKVVNRAAFKRLLQAGAATVLLCAPLLWRIGWEMVWQPAPLVQQESLRVTYSANLLGFIEPGFNLRAYGWLSSRLALSDPGLVRAHGIMGYEVFIGYTAAALALAGAVVRRRQALPYIILAGLFIVLALGPTVQIGSYHAGWSSPYQWLEAALPVFKVERAPVRHAGTALVALAVLFGLGLTAISERLCGARRQGLYLAAGAAVLLEFFQAPLPLTTIPIPGFVSQIKADPAPGSVLDLPFLPIIKRFAGIHQMHHERPLAIQLTKRIDDPDYNSSAIFGYLDRPRLWLTMTETERTGARGALLREFRERRVRYVVAYPKFMEAEDREGLTGVLDALGPEAVLVNDDDYIVYKYREQ